MTPRRPVQLLVGTLAIVLLLPAVSWGNHLQTAGTVAAQLIGKKSANTWIIEIKWTGACQAAAEPWYDGHLYMIDQDTGERHYVGGVVDASGQKFVSHTREWWVGAKSRAQRLKVELADFNCFEHFPLHGGPKITVGGNVVIVPGTFGGGGSGDGFGGGAGDYGSGDPTEPVESGGCGPVLLGTAGPDVIRGSAAGEIVFARTGNDRVDGLDGHDCLIGEQDHDRLDGGPGSDRLTGGRGNDVLIGGPQVNAYDAGPGDDFVNSRNRKRELVLCGSGRDRARADRRDRLRGCERVKRSGR